MTTQTQDTGQDGETGGTAAAPSVGTATGNGQPAPEAPVTPPAAKERDLEPGELVVEATRLVVGLAILLGEGFVALLERYGIPEPDLFAEGSARPEAPHTPPASLDVLGAAFGHVIGMTSLPEGSPAPRRRALAGFLFDAPRIAGGFAADVARRGEPLRRLVSRVTSLPPLAERKERAQELLDHWHGTGSLEIEASRRYAAAVLEGGVRLGVDWIVDNLNVNLIIQNLDLNSLLADLELTDVIVESTGGITERTLESVRSQAVGADGLVERIVSRVLRRNPSALPPGPRLWVAVEDEEEDEAQAAPTAASPGEGNGAATT